MRKLTVVTCTDNVGDDEEDALMKKRKLGSARPKKVRQSVKQRFQRKVAKRKNRVKKKMARKKYYRKNKRQIKIRTLKRKIRRARGDKRVAFRNKTVNP